MNDPPQLCEIANSIQQALTFHQQGQLARAEPLYRAILEKAPNHFDARHLLGVIELQRRNFETAVLLLSHAVTLNPHHAPSHLNIGTALRGLGRPGEALASYDRALAIRPDYAEALNNRGIALRDLERTDEALASYDHALALKPDFAEALNNSGNALRDLGRHDEALARYARALAIKPDYAEALNSCGNTLHGLDRLDEAIGCYDRALAIKPDYAEALNSRGAALFEFGRHEEAARDFARLLAIEPNFKYAVGNLLYSNLYSCDWAEYDGTVSAVEAGVSTGLSVASPSLFLSVPASPDGQHQCARSYVSDKYPAKRAIWLGERYRHDRIRIAYLSADFHDHATSRLMVELFETHDKSRFETIAVSFGPDLRDGLRARLERSFARFIDVGEKGDYDVALLLRALEIDIAVDLKGHTGKGRPRISSFRPAPIQVNYLGFPGTMGAEYIDYIIADRFVIPEDHHSFYSEKVVYLPDSYQPNDSKRLIGDYRPTRAEVGLPDVGFVFCSFNHNYKITPLVFDIWMRLLHQVEGSVLWLLGGSPAAIRNLRREAENRGIAPDRLVFAPRMKQEDHLARHRLAGIMLDTLPVNAHTTASDALWAGLPVVTCMGAGFAGRVAASLLNAVGLPELSTETLADYAALALELARNETMLAAIKAKLARNRDTYPLFDTDRFRRHIESAYETMWARHQRGEPAASFAVAPCETRHYQASLEKSVEPSL